MKTAVPRSRLCQVTFHSFNAKVSLDNMWLTISSGVLGFSFIFGNTLSQQLQTILLIFVVHPFDVGDALLLDGAFVTVEQTSLNKASAPVAPATVLPPCSASATRAMRVPCCMPRMESGQSPYGVRWFNRHASAATWHRVGLTHRVPFYWDSPNQRPL